MAIVGYFQEVPMTDAPTTTSDPTPVTTADDPDTISNDIVALMVANHANAPWPDVDQALRLVSLQIRLKQQTGLPIS
jgi:hypothetical protein